MALIFNCWFIDIFALVFSLVAVLYLYFTVKYTYWSKLGIPHLKSSFPFGNLFDVLFVRKQIGVVFADIYSNLEGYKYGGIFQLHRPTLVLRDPEIIKNFLVKDFAHFHDRGIYMDEVNDPLSAHLFSLSGAKWRNMRAKLTPTFTSGKMKMMYPTILDCGIELSDTVKQEAALGETIEVKDLISRFTTDVISSCAFGIKCNCLQNPDAEFRVKGRQLFDPNLILVIGFFLNVIAPSVAAVVKLGNLPKYLSDFFRNVVKETVEFREKNAVTRDDFMQLMIQLKNQGFIDVDAGDKRRQADTECTKRLTMDEVAAQAFVFFIAGFETSSTTVSFCLYELAVNPGIQDMLREEIDTVLSSGSTEITYEKVLSMEYLDRVVSETLRKYPPVPILNRACTVPYQLPENGVTLDAGMLVVVPVYGLQHDPKYYPNPEQFDPERFTATAKSGRNHYTYLPFGEGPRVCIGMRFGLLQTKIALISLLSKYKFQLSPKTAVPLKLDPKMFTLTALGGIFLKIVNRESP